MSDGPTGIEAAKVVAEYIRMRGALNDEGDAANIIHILRQAGVRFAPPTRDGAEGAGTLVPPVCCYCDADLSCAKCGMEQPADYLALPKPAPDAIAQQGSLGRRCVHGKLFNESCEGCGYIHPRDRVLEATPAQHVGRPKGEPAKFVRNGKLETCQCSDCRALSAPVPSPDGVGEKGGFAFPKIIIDWTAINGQQFETSRAHLLAKLTRFMSPDSKETAYWSSNHFTRSDMYVLHELLKAATAFPSPAVAAEPETEQQIEDRLMKQDAGDMLRLIDYIADKIGLPHDEELSRDNFNAWLATPPVRGDREAIRRTIRHNYKIRFFDGQPIRVLQEEAFIDAILSLPVQPGEGERPFQKRVLAWMMECFSMEICRDGAERNHRFLEESLELVQSLGCTASEAHQLVDYVFGRPSGDPVQELGGVMVTIAALCFPHELDMSAAAETELARVWKSIEKIRAKQAAKPKHSPLPVASRQAPHSSSETES